MAFNALVGGEILNQSISACQCTILRGFFSDMKNKSVRRQSSAVIVGLIMEIQLYYIVSGRRKEKNTEQVLQNAATTSVNLFSMVCRIFSTAHQNCCSKQKKQNMLKYAHFSSKLKWFSPTSRSTT